MGVYIKGIEMPKEGTVFVIDSSGQVWSNEWPTRGYTRLDGVTVVPVPKHGRLIDANELEETDPLLCAYNIPEYGFVEWSEWGYSREQIRNAPTIIEAEECE